MITYRNNYKYTDMNRLISTHRIPCFVSEEGLEAVTPQYQQALPPPRSYEGNQGSLEKGPILGLGRKYVR